MEYFIIELQKQLPVVKGYDVAVAGGGIAGISAALAAARRGKKVILIEKQCLLGGLATLGLITIYLPLCDGMGNQVIYGLGEELLRLSIKYGWEDRYPGAWLNGGTKEEKEKQRFEVQYNPHLFALSAEKLLIDTGVEILYDTKICGVSKKGNAIEALIIENKGGRRAIGASAFVDATGDADVCQYADAKTAVFNKNAVAAWHYSLSGKGYKLHMKGVIDSSRGSSDGNQPMQIGDRYYTGLDGSENSMMLITSHQYLLQDMLKQKEKDESYIPVTIPSIPQIRMTRRLVGCYELDEAEMGRKFDDSIGMTGDWRKRGPVYQIPFRCLYGEEIDNLISAGRCISVTSGMWDITRVIPACAVTGEAAGTAASILESSFSMLDISQLQQILIEQGAKVFF